MAILIIKGKLPNMNEILDAAKREAGRYRPYAEMKRIHTEAVEWYCKSQLKDVHFERVDLHFTWYCANKRKDLDNIMAGQKFVLDGLVNAGVIPNDGWRNINNITHSFDIDKTNTRIEVTITEA